MSEKPIIFSTEMVRAIIDGRKTQTRRVVNPQPNISIINDYKLRKPLTFWVDGDRWIKSLYQPGDILWVRETWTYHDGAVGGIIYKARCPEKLATIKIWRPSIHMPREAARIFLRVTDVRVERLQEIRPSDMEREGLNIGCRVDCPGDCGPWCSACEPFMKLWDNLNAKRGYGWDTNPWVWVYTFERLVNLKPADGYVDQDAARPILQYAT